MRNSPGHQVGTTRQARLEHGWQNTPFTQCGQEMCPELAAQEGEARSQSGLAKDNRGRGSANRENVEASSASPRVGGDVSRSGCRLVKEVAVKGLLENNPESFSRQGVCAREEVGETRFPREAARRASIFLPVPSTSFSSNVGQLSPGLRRPQGLHLLPKENEGQILPLPVFLDLHATMRKTQGRLLETQEAADVYEKGVQGHTEG